MIIIIDEDGNDDAGDDKDYDNGDEDDNFGF